MKLYQAMLNGAKTTYQAFGTWHDGDGGTCAMGAVMNGLGYVITSHDWYEAYKGMLEMFPQLLMEAKCPDCDKVSDMHTTSLMDVIMHLNDKHKWSRQRIAEWLSGSRVKQCDKQGVVA